MPVIGSQGPEDKAREAEGGTQSEKDQKQTLETLVGVKETAAFRAPAFMPLGAAHAALNGSLRDDRDLEIAVSNQQSFQYVPKRGELLLPGDQRPGSD